jgi:hypothetical protein
MRAKVFAAVALGIESFVHFDGSGPADEVKSLSPHHRFLVALHSPNGVLETGLRVCPSEKKVAKLAYNLQQDTFSSQY